MKRLIFSITLLLAGSIAAQTPCGPFEVLPVPTDPSWLRAEFEDVVALPGGQAFAVGSARRPAPPRSPETVTLAMHFDGNQWVHTPTPYTAPGPALARDYLHAVDALAPDDVWAAGERWGDAGGLSAGAWLLALHWDGSDWSQVPVPPPPGGTGINFSGPRVYDIAAIASDDVWFAGMWAEPNALATVTWRPLAMHWNGSEMSIAPTPVMFSGRDPLHATSIDAVASDDVWAVCRSNTAGGATNELFVLHYDGSSWSRVSTPPTPNDVVMNEIVARAANDVWVFGRIRFGPPIAFHFDGIEWTQVNGVPAVFAAGKADDGIYLGETELSFFDGTSFTTVASLAGVTSPQLFDVDAADGCNVWAVGRRFITGRDLQPLAVRTKPGSWVDHGGGLAGAAGEPTLTGSGRLTRGSLTSLDLAGGAASAPLALILGSGVAGVPFLGGTIVPTPDLVLGGMATDPAGRWTFGFTWPRGVPSGAGATFQTWLLDSSAPSGLAASNGISAIAP